MLRISKLADYAVLMMHCLESSKGQLLSASDVANRTQVALPTVRKVLKILCEAGLLNSTRGSDGGYGLSRAADQIKVSDIITAIEGQPALTECSATANTCTQNDSCAVKHNWQVINHYILFTLQRITLADMVMPLSVSDLQKKMVATDGR